MAFSKSPSESVKAFLHSTMGAPDMARISLSWAMEMSAKDRVWGRDVRILEDSATVATLVHRPAHDLAAKRTKDDLNILGETEEASF